MAFWIFGTIEAMTVERILGFFEDRCACLPRPLKVRIHVVHTSGQRFIERRRFLDSCTARE
jgi:hypothetical protein